MHPLKVAVIGLGSMGYGIAQSLLRQNHTTFGFDINPQRQLQLQDEGAAVGELETIAETLDAVIVVVLNAAQVGQVLFADTALVSRLAPGAVVLNCATVAPDFARDMEARCVALGVHYLDAPISGGSVKAARGELSIMAAGSAAAFAKSKPLLDAMADTVFELGPSAGLGSALKAVNQLLAGVHIAAMAEALTFGMSQGIAPDTFLEIISQCAGSSWMLENRAPHIVAGDYTPHSKIDIWPKDLGIVLELAKQTKFHAPIASAALAQFKAAVEQGMGEEDDAAVAKVYARQAGLQLPMGD